MISEIGRFLVDFLNTKYLEHCVDIMWKIIP